MADQMKGNLKGLLKTHNCGELRASDNDETVTLCGWIGKYRDLGGLHFIDLRDKYGITQLSFENFTGDLKILKSFSLESVISCTGKVRSRPSDAQNKNMPTGEIEVDVLTIEELSHAMEVPFLPHSKTQATEDLRLKYRYLDLRTNRLQDILKLRSDTARLVRESLYAEGFTEVETPILYKTTPEGARDYIVPSRVHPGRVYALPQSPQTLKQLLMMSSLDKYFQICKCFRDEDLRADRQPEFSQIDIEVSFATQEYIKNLATSIIKNTFKFDELEIPVVSYREAMDLYGSDKPDLRYGLEQYNVTSMFKNSEFAIFNDVANKNGLIKLMFVESELGSLNRKDLDHLTEVVKPYGGKGVAFAKINANSEISSGISKFLNPTIVEELNALANKNNKEGIFLFCASPKESITHACADAVRKHLGQKLNLVDPNVYKFLWVNDFPLFDYDEDDKRFYAKHHPFTMPKKEFVEDFLSDDHDKLKNVLADAYDIVCNGYELGGGSLRIYNSKIQSQMFTLLGFTPEEAQRQFGFFVEALNYGTPPHGGMAFGLDRLIMMLAKTDNIRDVIAFPKTASATDLMAQAPSLPTKEQLQELKIKID
jgi:aspartyl-tRNA synthetase